MWEMDQLPWHSQKLFPLVSHVVFYFFFLEKDRLLNDGYWFGWFSYPHKNDKTEDSPSYY